MFEFDCDLFWFLVHADLLILAAFSSSVVSTGEVQKLSLYASCFQLHCVTHHTQHHTLSEVEMYIGAPSWELQTPSLQVEIGHLASVFTLSSHTALATSHAALAHNENLPNPHPVCSCQLNVICQSKLSVRLWFAWALFSLASQGHPHPVCILSESYHGKRWLILKNVTLLLWPLSDSGICPHHEVIIRFHGCSNQ